MKKLIIALTVAALTGTVYAETETKKVCVTQKDQKTGKDKEVCKTIKIHKKLEPAKK